MSRSNGYSEYNLLEVTSNSKLRYRYHGLPRNGRLNCKQCTLKGMPAGYMLHFGFPDWAFLVDCRSQSDDNHEAGDIADIAECAKRALNSKGDLQVTSSEDSESELLN